MKTKSVVDVTTRHYFRLRPSLLWLAWQPVASSRAAMEWHLHAVAITDEHPCADERCGQDSFRNLGVQMNSQSGWLWPSVGSCLVLNDRRPDLCLVHRLLARPTLFAVSLAYLGLWKTNKKQVIIDPNTSGDNFNQSKQEDDLELIHHSNIQVHNQVKHKSTVSICRQHHRTNVTDFECNEFVEI